MNNLDLADIAEMLPPLHLWQAAEGMARTLNLHRSASVLTHELLLSDYNGDSPAINDHDAIRFAKISPFVLAWILMYDVPATGGAALALSRIYNDLQDITNAAWKMRTPENEAWVDEVRAVMRSASFAYHRWTKRLPPDLRKAAPRADERNLNWTTKRARC